MVAAKMLHADVALGGLSRITFQMSTTSLETAAMRRSIELLGTEVAPIVRAARPIRPPDLHGLHPRAPFSAATTVARDD